MFKTIADVRTANKAIGNHFFDRGTMKFWRSRIESKLLQGEYFITSEQSSDTAPRFYSIRQVSPDGRIWTLGKIQGFLTKEEAKEFLANSITKGGKQLAK